MKKKKDKKYNKFFWDFKFSLSMNKQSKLSPYYLLCNQDSSLKLYLILLIMIKTINFTLFTSFVATEGFVKLYIWFILESSTFSGKF